MAADDSGAPAGTRAPLVIGAGFLGTHVVRRALVAGADVRVLSRSPVEGDRRARLEGARVIVSDASVDGVVAAALEGVDHVFYCAGGLMPAQSNLDPATDAALALPPLLRVLEELRRRPGAGLTFLSSGGTVYGPPTRMPVAEDHPTDPQTSYGVMKLASEKYALMYARLYGVPVRILRVANVFGEYQPSERDQGFVAAALRRILTGKPITMFGDGLNVRDYVSARDVAGVMLDLTAAPKLPAVLNVGSGAGLTLLEVVRELERATGQEAALEWRPDRGLDVREIVLDVTALRRLVPFVPTPFGEAIAATVAAVSGG